MILEIVKEFGKYPGGRYRTDGPLSGQELREDLLVPALKDAITFDETLEIRFDGTLGYSSAFLEEAFGGILRHTPYKFDQIMARLELKSSEVRLTERVVEFMRSAENRRDATYES